MDFFIFKEKQFMRKKAKKELVELQELILKLKKKDSEQGLEESEKRECLSLIDEYQSKLAHHQAKQNDDSLKKQEFVPFLEL